MSPSDWAVGASTHRHHVMKGMDIAVEVLQVKYLNNIVVQDHRAVKRNTRPVLGYKSCFSQLTPHTAVIANKVTQSMFRKPWTAALRSQ